MILNLIFKKQLKIKCNNILIYIIYIYDFTIINFKINKIQVLFQE